MLIDYDDDRDGSCAGAGDIRSAAAAPGAAANGPRLERLPFKRNRLPFRLKGNVSVEAPRPIRDSRPADSSRAEYALATSYASP